MKTHITLIVVAGLALVGLLAGIFTAYPLESASTRLDRQINDQVEIAQRMLLDYRPITTQLSMHLGPATTQPVEVSPEDWQEHVAKTGQEGPASSELNALGGEVRKVNSQFDRIEGESTAPPVAAASGSEAYRGLQADLKYNDRLLTDALQVVQQAINLSEGECSGADHPGATRLASVLCYHRADQLRREAAFHWAQADDAQTRLIQDATRWQRLKSDLASTERELGIAASQPASVPANAGSQPAEEAPADALPPIDERVARMEQEKDEVIASIEKARGEAARLTETIGQLKQRIDVAKQEASEAEQQMLKLQHDGVDPSDPSALARFTEAYEKASAANRAAYREATILEQGSQRGAQVKTSDEDEVLVKPLVPAQSGGQITTERGLVAYESDLKAVQAFITGQEGVVKELGHQITELAAHKKDMTDRAASLTAALQRVADQLTEYAKAALASSIEALRLDQEGLDMAQNRGIQAAQRAKRATEKRISEAQQLNSERGPDSQNQRLLLISKDTASPGNAIALMGDLQLLAAQIQADEAKNLLEHARLLEKLEQLGMAIDAKLLPEGVTPESAPPGAVQVEAAKDSAEKDLVAAIESAKQSLESYAQADTLLQQLWVLHANMATVHHLMANLTTGKESLQHANDARIEYLRAMKGREERPEIPTFQTAMASLTTRPAN